MPRRAPRRARSGMVGNRRAPGARERMLPRRVGDRPLRTLIATKSRRKLSWPTRWRRAARSFIRASTLRRARSSRDGFAIVANSRAARMEFSSRPSRRKFSTAKVSRKFWSVFPASPSDSKVSDWAVAGVIMIVSSANSAAKRSAWGSPIHFSCSIESPSRDSTGGLTTLRPSPPFIGPAKRHCQLAERGRRR